MEDAWWDGYEAGMSGDGRDNPYPVGIQGGLWELGRAFGCQALANILEGMMTLEEDAK